ncbi:MAG: hypothetical protein HYX40_05230 [Sphingobacteriales bacterium]|nr:hypothetical protein [Sphingobacteriales bacterium]
MNIIDLSIADLKASYDFTVLYLDEIKKQRNKVQLDKSDLPVIKQTKALKKKLYIELVKRINNLK